ncbi:HipA family kinase [Sphingobium sp. CECT 9361]|uniref:HipA family kinase n=1 Tax=Sphingobium sp. CECT 9361 TaxID=2845384 RepID=UPI0033A13FE8
MRATKSGQTRPFQCILEDGQIYAVKGRGAQPHGLIAEVCAARLGRLIDLPVPDFVIADVPDALIRESTLEGVWSGLGAGPAFGSKWHDAAEPITPSMRDRSDPYILATIYVFDHWIANADRTLGETAGNPNLLYKLADGSLVVFDHNLSFDSEYSCNELYYHAGRTSWQKVCQDVSFRNDILMKLAYAFHKLNEIMSDLPDEWLEDAPWMPGLVLQTLERKNHKIFWDQLG